ncbi:hypothetical protein [Desulforapulum autotrophicum]|nr:hypothetical protein [Desulforapulum autotrophicum]
MGADLAINGNRIMALLNLNPGPKVGQIMDVLFDQVLDTPDLNTPSAMETLVLSPGP